MGQTREKVIKVDKLQAGMRLSQDIENKYGAVMIPAGTILTERKINRLQDLAYQQVKVVRESQEEIEANIEGFSRLERSYREDVKKAASLYKQIKFQGKIDEDILIPLARDAMNLGSEMEINDLLNMVQGVDEYTYTHLLNVGILSNMMGKWLGFEGEKLLNLTKSGILHDVGKSKIPEEILNKPDSLEPEEYEIMKRHSYYGYEILHKTDFIKQDTALGVLTHHEYYNGRGYPLQLQGEDIPIFGRIIAIVDAFDAITSERVYQQKSNPFVAMEKIQKENFGYCDPGLKKMFLAKIPNFFVREKVKLSNGKIGRVVYVNNTNPSSPIVKIGEEYLNLSEENNITVEEVLGSAN